MADNQRSHNSVLRKRVTENARNIEFIQLVKLLDRIGQNSDDSIEQSEYTHESEYENEDQDKDTGLGSIFFRANPSLGFPAGDVSSVSLSPFGHFEVCVNFMGLYGPSSPLPAYFTEYLIHEMVAKESEDAQIIYLKTLNEIKALRDQQLDFEVVSRRNIETKKAIKAGVLQTVLLTSNQFQEILERNELDTIFDSNILEQLKAGQIVIEVHTPVRTNQRDFLDLFNHKFIQMYLQASLKYRPYLSWLNKAQSNYIEMLYSLIGAPSKSERESSVLKWEKLLPVVGLLGVNRSAPEVIQKVVAKYLDFDITRVNIELAVERVAQVPSEQYFLLGKQSCRLQEDAVLGATVRDASHKFRVHIYELSEEQYMQFCPYGNAQNSQGARYIELTMLLAYLTSANQIFDICLHLAEAESIRPLLTNQAQFCLGFSSWLGESGEINTSTII